MSLMSVKRGREEDDGEDTQIVAAKRPKVDLDLAQLWENLANEDEDARLNAAKDLRVRYLATKEKDGARQIIKRLFRGLCSGRKAARLGFFVAITSILRPTSKSASCPQVSVSEFIEILQRESTAESGASGQDERDHHYGCVLGCMAIFTSEALFNHNNNSTGDWTSLCRIVCERAAQKPWIRPEAGHVLCQAASALVHIDTDHTKFLTAILESMKQHSLLQSREGIALWITIRGSFRSFQSPPQLWKQGNPFDKKNLKALTRILLDSHGGSSQGDDDDDVMGNSGWLPTVHFVWPLVLQYLSRNHDRSQVEFRQFWRAAVSEGLFGVESSPERKHTGFSVLEKAVEIVPPELIQDCFSKNIMTTALQALRKSDQSYLAQRTKLCFDKIVELCSHYQDKALVVVKGMLLGSDFADFDATTGHKTMQTLMDSILTDEEFRETLLSWLTANPNESGDVARSSVRRRNLLTVLARSMCARLNRASLDGSSETDLRSLDRLISDMVDLKFKISERSANGLEWNEDALTTLREKTAQMLEALLRADSWDRSRLFDVLQILRPRDIAAEEKIRSTVQKAWKWSDKVKTEFASRADHDVGGSFVAGHKPEVGVATLLMVLLYQIHDGDTDAVSLLEETLEILIDLWTSDKKKSVDMLVDVVISITSKPSRFLRQMGTAVFEDITALVSVDGLQPLITIFATKEGREGQQNLFEADDGVEELQSEDDVLGSENEELDSDVEVVHAEGGSVGDNDRDSESSSSDTFSSAASSEVDGDANEEGMNDLEKALAQALGTRQGNDADGADESDSDMSDSDMLELDNKISEVFRNQLEKTSAQRERSQEQKNAKENVVNLKNRTLDLAETYLRTQKNRGDGILTLLMPILRLTRTTSSKQIADRGRSILKNFFQRVKVFNMDVDDSTLLLTAADELHRELEAKGVSNESIAVASQLNIFLCKLALQHGQSGLVEDTKKRRPQKESSRKALGEFWQRWDEWLKTAQEKYPIGENSNSKQSKQDKKVDNVKRHKQRG